MFPRVNICKHNKPNTLAHARNRTQRNFNRYCKHTHTHTHAHPTDEPVCWTVCVQISTATITLRSLPCVLACFKLYVGHQRGRRRRGCQWS